MVEPILELRGVSKTFFLKRASIFRSQRILPAVKSVTLSIKPGETFGIIGESGCGKSTLARLMVGLHAADNGFIRLDGKCLGKMPSSDRNRTIQYVFQDPERNPRIFFSGP